MAIAAEIPAGWDIDYAINSSPGTTVWLPIELAPSATLPLTISLHTPVTETSGLYTLTITVTLLSSPTVNVTVYEQTYIRRRFVYLPLVLRNYAPFRNGSFENGLAGWTVPVEAKLPANVVSTAVRDDTKPSVGSRMALLGDPTYPCDGVPVEYAAVEQTFVVPTNTTSMLFDYIIWTQDVSLDETYDRFEVYLWRCGESITATPVYSDGNKTTVGVGCAKWWRIPEEENSWKEGRINLERYQEQLVTVSFRVYNRQDNWYNTYAYLDNIRFEP